MTLIVMIHADYLEGCFFLISVNQAIISLISVLSSLTI